MRTTLWLLATNTHLQRIIDLSIFHGPLHCWVWGRTFSPLRGGAMLMISQWLISPSFVGKGGAILVDSIGIEQSYLSGIILVLPFGAEPSYLASFHS